LLVWLIFLNYVLNEPFLLLPLRLIYSGKLAHPLVALAVALLGTIQALAAIFLFRLRTVAIQLFAAALALSLALDVPALLILFRAPLKLDLAQLGGELWSYIIPVAILLYAVRLKRRGVLF
jgi:hypothetical protein